MKGDVKAWKQKTKTYSKQTLIVCKNGTKGYGQYSYCSSQGDGFKDTKTK